MRAEHLAMLDDLKDRLAKAEMSSEEYRKQAEVLQARFDDVNKEHVKYEEKCHELEEQSEALQNEKREATRKIREMEAIYEAERSAMVKEKEEHANREEELQMVIARLKDSLNQQKMTPEDEPRPSRSSKFSTAGPLEFVPRLLTAACSQPGIAIPRRRQLRSACFAPAQRLQEPVQVDPPEGQADRVSAAGTRRGPDQAGRVREPGRRQTAGGRAPPHGDPHG